MRCVALLSGVNVGGHRRVPMAQLRAVLAGLGLTDATTYLQSGNAVFSAEDGDPAALETRIHDAIRADLGVDTRVLVRTAAELADVVAGNPWPERAATPAQLHAVFLTAVPTAVPDLSSFAPDEGCVQGRVAYLWYAEGAGRSKLTVRMLGVDGTARNWTTVTRLAELAALAAAGLPG